MKGIDELWQADLVDMSEYAKENKNHKFLLTVIDCFSKYAWVKPILRKDKTSVLNALAKIFDESKRKPQQFQTDNGKEFYNAEMQRFLKKNNIHHYSTYSVLKASIVERFNRTLKEKMWKQFSMQGTYKYLDLLEKLTNKYNDTYHRTIQMKPKDVKKSDEKRLLKTAYNYNIRLVKNKYRVGESVRISKYKHVFEKGYTPNWTTEIFKIVAVSNKFPITYTIEDLSGNQIAGRFYEYEIQRVSNPDVYLVEKILSRKEGKVFVKWLGFDSKHNSWINSKDLI